MALNVQVQAQRVSAEAEWSRSLRRRCLEIVTKGKAFHTGYRKTGTFFVKCGGETKQLGEASGESL